MGDTYQYHLSSECSASHVSNSFGHCSFMPAWMLSLLTINYSFKTSVTANSKLIFNVFLSATSAILFYSTSTKASMAFQWAIFMHQAVKDSSIILKTFTSSASELWYVCIQQSLGKILNLTFNN